jgi:aspartate/methionine/tyrosine aminotransferase
MQALDGARAQIRSLSLENLAQFAGARIGDPSVIPLWFGEGDVRTPAFIGEAARRAVEAGEVFYTHQNGVPALRETLASYLSGLGRRPIGPERVTVTAGGMYAIMLALQLTCEAGDNLVVVEPVWPNAGGMAGLLGCEVRRVRMDHGANGWSLDLERLSRTMDARTRAVFFASPGNPTGAMLPIELQAQMLDECRRRGVWLIADEVYNRLVFGRRAGPTILDLAEPEDRVIVVNSFSKSWAMTGWRLGWLVHPPSLGPTLAMMVQYTTSGVTTFLQHAGVAAIRDGEPFVEWMRGYCEAGMGIVCDALETMGRVRLGPRPQAGMYAFFEVDGAPDSRAAARAILAATDVGLAPGYFFGPGSEGFLRACVCREPGELAEAMARLRRALS